MYADIPTQNCYSFNINKTFDIYGRIQTVAKHFTVDLLSTDHRTSIITANGSQTGTTFAYEITPFTLLANTSLFQRQMTSDGLILRTSFDQIKLHHLTILCSRTARNTQGNTTALAYIPNSLGSRRMYESIDELTLETASRFPIHVVGKDDIQLTVSPDLTHGKSHHPLRVDQCFGLMLWHSTLEHPVTTSMLPCEDNLILTFRGKVTLISHQTTPIIWKTCAPAVILPDAYASYCNDVSVNNPISKLESSRFANGQISGRPWKFRKRSSAVKKIQLHGEVAPKKRRASLVDFEVLFPNSLESSFEDL